MNEFRYRLNEMKEIFVAGMNDLNKKVNSLGNRVTPLEGEVKLLRMRHSVAQVSLDVHEFEKEREGVEIERSDKNGGTAL